MLILRLLENRTLSLIYTGLAAYCGAWFFINNQIVQIRTALEDRCTILARNLASSSEFGVLTGNKDFLKKLNDIVLNEEDVVYSIIYDKNGQALALNERAETKNLYKDLEPLINYRMHAATRRGPPYENQYIKDIIKLTYNSKAGQPVHDTICPGSSCPLVYR